MKEQSSHQFKRALQAASIPRLVCSEAASMIMTPKNYQVH
jgi:hypothetical protein